MRCCWLWVQFELIWAEETVLDERRRAATSHTSEVGPWLACVAVNHRIPQRGLWLEQHSEGSCLTLSLTMGPVSSLPQNKMRGGAETGLRGYTVAALNPFFWSDSAETETQFKFNFSLV